MQLLGWLGSLAFGLCGVPQAWSCYRHGHAYGLSKPFLWLWLIGEVLTLAYVLSLALVPWPLVLNYGINLVCLGIIFRYRYWPLDNWEPI